MSKPTREQALSLGLFALVLLGSLAFALLSLRERAEAARELDARREALAGLEARVPTARARAAPAAPRAAPAAAFLDAPTQGLASAALEARLTRLAAARRAVLVSAGQAGGAEDEPGTIRLQATLDLGLTSLQALLQDLESGTPYVFIESLSVQPSSAAASFGQEPVLRAALGLRALWHRGRP